MLRASPVSGLCFEHRRLRNHRVLPRALCGFPLAPESQRLTSNYLAIYQPFIIRAIHLRLTRPPGRSNNSRVQAIRSHHSLRSPYYHWLRRTPILVVASYHHFSYVYYPLLEERLMLTLFSHDLGCSLTNTTLWCGKFLEVWELPFLTRIPIWRCAGACGVHCHHWVGREITSSLFLGLR